MRGYLGIDESNCNRTRSFYVACFDQNYSDGSFPKWRKGSLFKSFIKRNIFTDYKYLVYETVTTRSFSHSELMIISASEAIKQYNPKEVFVDGFFSEESVDKVLRKVFPSKPVISGIVGGDKINSLVNRADILAGHFYRNHIVEKSPLLLNRLLTPKLEEYASLKK